MNELHRLWGQNVAEGRRKLGLTQVQLAEQCKVTQQAISFIERGYNAPRDDLKIRLATALHQDVRHLFPLTRVVA